MKTISIKFMVFMTFVGLSLCNSQFSQAQILLTDNFSSATSWTISNSTPAGTAFNNIAIANGTLNFTDVHCRAQAVAPTTPPSICEWATSERRARRSMTTTLNEHDAFGLEINFRFADTTTTSTSPLGSIPMALTAGINEVVTSDSGNSNQDAIGFLFSTGITSTGGSCADSRTGNPTLAPFFKDGTNPMQAQAGITLIRNQTYRLRLERISATLFTFQVFNLSSTTPNTCIFSSSFCLPANTVLTGFNAVQTANLHQGSVARRVTSTVDNLTVQLVNKISDTYSSVFFTENFNSGLTGWTRNNVNTNNIPINVGTTPMIYNNIGLFNNELHVKDVHCGGMGTTLGNGQCDGASAERRIYRQLPTGVPATWRLNFDFSWVNSLYDNGTSTSPATPMGSIPMCLSAGTSDVVANTLPPNTIQTNTNQDAIGVMYISGIVNNLTNPCASTPDPTNPQPQLCIFYKDGTINPTLSTARISLNQQNGNYFYISLDRLDAVTLRLSVFTDANRNQHSLGSPITMNIPTGITITGLNTLQEANLYKDSRGRSVSNRIDNIQILTPDCGTQYNASFNLSGTCNSPNFTINATSSVTNPTGTTHRWYLYRANSLLGGVGNSNFNALLQTSLNTTANFTNVPIRYSDSVLIPYIVRHIVGVAPFFVETRTLITSASLIQGCSQKWDETGTSDAPLQVADLFPNPSSTTINIAYNSIEGETASLFLYDITGKMVLQETVEGNQTNTIDVSNLSNGIYIARITGKSINQSLKFIKQ
jgi:hypothetical protein